eukprot:GFUD01020217.1.p1 GENE.GFUD01020217.1~~GFUD01020217.1.p1  ORF type:complete len:184 (-),score=63.28 GFUD01020217.1:31-582(-)
MSEDSAPKFERKHHTPDEIIDGKPKWSKVELVRDNSTKTKTLNIDRLNPTRTEMEELDEQFGENSDDYQQVMVHMMADLQSEVMVTLGDSRLDAQMEELMMQKNLEWECYKKKHSIEKWVPTKEKQRIAPMFKTVEKKKFKKQGKKPAGVIRRKINSSVQKSKQKRVTDTHKHIKISSLNVTL